MFWLHDCSVAKKDMGGVASAARAKWWKTPLHARETEHRYLKTIVYLNVNSTNCSGKAL